MFSTANPVGLRFVGSSAALSLLLLSGCGRDPLSLPVAQAAASTTHLLAETAPPRRIRVDPSFSEVPIALIRQTTDDLYQALPSQSCYAFMLRRPRGQRATAVQARLKEADQMSAALDSETFKVDLVGDHANILSLEFPVQWPALPAYSQKVSSVIVDYLSVPEIQDYLCNSGFSEVKLSARGLNDGQAHLLWTARVTSEGLMKLAADGKRERLSELITP